MAVAESTGDRDRRPGVLALELELAAARAFTALATELAAARAKWGPMVNAHEAASVIREEYEEFWDEVKAQHQSPAGMRKELLHTAAMAMRAILDLGLVDA